MVVPSRESGFMEVTNRPRTERSARARPAERARLEAGAHGPGWYRQEEWGHGAVRVPPNPGFPTLSKPSEEPTGIP